MPKAGDGASDSDRIESKAGHGAGKPTSKRIDEAADMYAFLFQNIGVPYKVIKN